MRSSLYFHEKPDRFVQQARPLADVLESHQDVMDREAYGILLIIKVRMWIRVNLCVRALVYVCEVT